MSYVINRTLLWPRVVDTSKRHSSQYVQVSPKLHPATKLPPLVSQKLNFPNEKFLMGALSSLKPQNTLPESGSDGSVQHFEPVASLAGVLGATLVKQMSGEGPSLVSFSAQN